jgi:xanthine dehydrogenase large subunit
VLLAIRAAIASAAPDALHAPRLRAPATPEAILDALDTQANETAAEAAADAAQPAPVN